MTIEELKEQIINDIKNIQKNNNALQTMLATSSDISDQNKNLLIDIINFFRDDDNFKFLSAISTKRELFDIEKNIKSFLSIMKSYMSVPIKSNLDNLIKNSMYIYEFIEKILDKIEQQNNNTSDEINNEENFDSISNIASRLEKLEKEPKKLIKEAEHGLYVIKDTLGTIEENEKELIRLSNNISELRNKTKKDIGELVSNTKKELNILISDTKKVRDKEMSVELSVQLEEKAVKLGKERIPKLWIVFISLLLLFVSNVLSSAGLTWEGMVSRFVLNMPILILIVFALNEYTKANKLYEEYEFKRISAITLFNNHSRLKNELGITSEELSESLKSSMDKIFDNPVHSIYGDKSMDKNIGLEQLEKIISMIEKLSQKSK